MNSRRGDRGDTVVQTVIVAPALFLMIMAIIQIALVAHARNVAEAAAQDGVNAARQFDGTTATGHQAANQALDTLGPKMLTDRHISVDRTTTTASVTITGRSLSFIPGVSPRIEVTSVASIERWAEMDGGD